MTCSKNFHYRKGTIIRLDVTTLIFSKYTLNLLSKRIVFCVVFLLFVDLANMMLVKMLSFVGNRHPTLQYRFNGTCKVFVGSLYVFEYIGTFKFDYFNQRLQGVYKFYSSYNLKIHN